MKGRIVVVNEQHDVGDVDDYKSTMARWYDIFKFVALRCSCGFDVVKFLSLLYYLSFLNVAS